MGTSTEPFFNGTTCLSSDSFDIIYLAYHHNLKHYDTILSILGTMQTDFFVAIAIKNINTLINIGAKKHVFLVLLDPCMKSLTI